ncbi:LysR substrate-binding domain-containing protein [Vibrio kyushuensis]|uniref:LysR family transcriptional regulator n=1 Tax=Vibrio TaxID=662 RepID=UPI003D0F7ABC
MRPFQQLDLNLLRVFKVLSEELHTGRAAERLCTTQPGVSRSLSRLRDHFEDRLFIKTRDGLAPTPMAARLALVIPNTLDSLSDTIESLEVFDIEKKSGVLKIAVSAFLAVSLPAKLHLKLREVAPNLRLEVENWGAATANSLAKGELDFALNYYPVELPKEVISRPLTEDTFQLLARKDHPLVGSTVPIKEYENYPFVSTIVKGWNDRATIVSRIIANKNLSIDMCYRSEAFSSVVQVVAETDSILPCTALLDEKQFPQLSRVPVPEGVEVPVEEVRFYSHQRLRHDPYHEYLFTLIKTIIDEL